MRTIAELLEAVRLEAIRADFPVDRAVYERSAKDPSVPVLFAGSLHAPVCVFGRDLGKDEVAVGEPLVGAGGRLVRAAIYHDRRGEPPKPTDKRIPSVLEDVLLTNTVPYKPPGNNAYSDAVKERFRPFVAELLVGHWTGTHVFSLGNQAFEWFARYSDPGLAAELWAKEDRYERDLPCVLTAEIDGRIRRKSIALGPLPHPSPLNARWYAKFPGLIARRLERIRA